MPGGAVTFILDDGAKLLIPDEELRRVYEALWNLASERGAISTAALVIGARRLRAAQRQPIMLTTEQSGVLRKAVEAHDGV